MKTEWIRLAMIIVQNKFTSFILGKNYSAMCLSPFLFINRGFDIKEQPETINHEKIHARQQIEMLWIFFFLWYIAEYLVRLLKYHSHHLAYRNLAHEREAYANSGNAGYLKERKPYSWIRFF